MKKIFIFLFFCALLGCSKESQNQKPVIIPNRAYQWRMDIEEFNVPEGTTSIGEYAFSGCTNLKSITIPNSVTKIGNNVFNGCYYLKSITLPSELTNIGEYAFYYCRSIDSIYIPKSVTKIGTFAFGKCENLTLIIPKQFEGNEELGLESCKEVIYY